MSWFNFYKNRVNSSYLEYAEKRYSTMIDFIVSYLPEKDGTAVEAGCGIGTISRLVKKRNKDTFILGFDNCEHMLKLANANVQEDIWLLKRDILTYTGPALWDKVSEDKRSDVAYSHGVLEHFTDDEIRTIISNQKQYAKNIVHYVPSSKYKVLSFGDERLMSSEEWTEICSPKEIIKFNDDYDLLLIW